MGRDDFFEFLIFDQNFGKHFFFCFVVCDWLLEFREKFLSD